MAAQWYAWSTSGAKENKPKIAFKGKWANQYGSIMKLTTSGDKVTGKYRTAVGAPPVVKNFDLVGVVNGDLISFIVNWGEFGSITAWVGEHTVDKGGKEKLVTMWHLVKNISENDEESSLWGAFLDGSDIFHRIP